MSVDVSTTQSPVAVSVNDTTVSVVVSGGIGPQGPSGAASPATTSTLGGIIVGSNLTVTADGTLSATGGGAVSSVAGRTGAVTLSNTDISGLGTLATQSGTFSGTSSGTNSGDQTISLTGDVTGSGTGSFAATLAASGATAGTYTSVTVDTKGRVTAGTTPAAVTSVAGRTGAVTIASSDVSGLATVATSGSAADLTGTLSDARLSDAVALAATVATMNHGSATAIDTVARNIVAVSYQNTSNNTIYWTFFTPQVTLTVGNISMCTGSSASTNLTAVIMALYTFDETTYTMVARTASDTTLFNATATLYTKPFDTATGYPATYTLQKGVRYGVGVWMQGTTLPTMAGAAVNAQVHTLSPRVSGYRGSQSSIPTSGTVFTANNLVQIWSRLT